MAVQLQLLTVYIDFGSALGSALGASGSRLPAQSTPQLLLSILASLANTLHGVAAGQAVPPPPDE